MKMEQTTAEINSAPYAKDSPRLPMKDLGDALDLLSDVRWHIEVMELATRHNPEDDAKAFSALIHTTLEKFHQARGALEALWQQEQGVAR